MATANDLPARVSAFSYAYFYFGFTTEGRARA